MTRQHTIAAVTLLALLSVGPSPACAQIQTQVERDISAARQEAQDRQNEANAREARERAKGTGTPALSNADIARIQGENARSRAYDAAKSSEMDAYVAAAAQRRTDFISGAQKQMWLAEVAELQAHPAPVAAPGSYTTCDQLASANGDETRPLGLEAPKEINVPAALVACRAEVARSPQSARAHYELARAMLEGLEAVVPPTGITCSEAIDELHRAESLGSSRAVSILATRSNKDCKFKDTLAFDKVQLRKAVDMGNADAAFDLGVVFSKESDDRGLTDAQRHERHDAMKWMWRYAVGLYAKRAMEGDMYAIYRAAVMADDKYIAYWTFDYVQDPARWVYKCQARHYKPCESFTPKTS